MKIQKKIWGRGRGGAGVLGRGVSGWGGQGGCARRIEVFVKIQEKKWGGGVRGVGLGGGQGGCE